VDCRHETLVKVIGEGLKFKGENKEIETFSSFDSAKLESFIAHNCRRYLS